MGKTCVPKPNRVDAAISVEEYGKNRGALEEGDEELLKSFEEAVAAGLSHEEWAVAGFTVVSEGGTRYMNLTGVTKLTTFVFHINEGRKVWQLDNFDSQMIH